MSSWFFSNIHDLILKPSSRSFDWHHAMLKPSIPTDTRAFSNSTPPEKKLFSSWKHAAPPVLLKLADHYPEPSMIQPYSVLPGERRLDSTSLWRATSKILLLDWDGGLRGCSSKLTLDQGCPSIRTDFVFDFSSISMKALLIRCSNPHGEPVVLTTDRISRPILATKSTLRVHCSWRIKNSLFYWIFSHLLKEQSIGFQILIPLLYVLCSSETPDWVQPDTKTCQKPVLHRHHSTQQVHHKNRPGARIKL